MLLSPVAKHAAAGMRVLCYSWYIQRHTIYDWQRKNTNPGADKIMVICEALQITPEELHVGRIYEGIEVDMKYEVSFHLVTLK